MQKIEIPAGRLTKVVRSEDVERLVVEGWQVVYTFTQVAEVVCHKIREMTEADIAAWKARYHDDPPWAERRREYHDRELHPVMMFVMVHDAADELGRLTTELAEMSERLNVADGAFDQIEKELEEEKEDHEAEKTAHEETRRLLKASCVREDALERRVRAYEIDMAKLREAVGSVAWKKILKED